MVFPCTSVMVIMVLLNEAFTCATPEVMFLRSLRRTRVVSVLANLVPLVRYQRRRNPSGYISRSQIGSRATGTIASCRLPPYFFLPAIALAGPLRVRALVWVRWPRTGRGRGGGGAGGGGRGSHPLIVFVS